MSKENMGRNAEHYVDPTPTAAMRNIIKDERQKEAVRLDRIGNLVPLLRQMAALSWCPPRWWKSSITERGTGRWLKYKKEGSQCT